MKKTQKVLDILKYIDEQDLSKLELERLESEIDSMTGVTIPKRNKWQEDTAKEIKNRIEEIGEDCIESGYSKDDMLEQIINYINKEHLFLSDYTKGKN